MGSIFLKPQSESDINLGNRLFDFFIMLRRVGFAATASSSKAELISFRGRSSTNCTSLQTYHREFHSMIGLVGSLTMCGASMLCFGSWANNYFNVKKYGRWRFRNTVDDVIMVEDFKQARWIGAFVGFLFWWFVVGPQKYRWNSNLEEIPGNIRFGPF